MSGAETFWRAQLAGFVQPVGIKDSSPGVTPPSSNELSHGWAELRLAADAMRPLEQSARRHGLTLSTLVHGAWALLMQRYTGADDLLFGSIGSGRQCSFEGIETVLGLTAATQPLRTRVPADASLGAWLRLLQLQMAEMREHEHTSLALIQAWSDVPAEKRPMFDSIVVVGNYVGNDLATCSTAALTVSGAHYATQPLFAFTLFATVDPTLALTLVYDRKRCAADFARRLLDEIVQLLAGMAENPEQRVASLVDRRAAPRS